MLYLTVRSDGGEDGGGVKGEKAAKPVTTARDNKIFLIISSSLWRPEQVFKAKCFTNLNQELFFLLEHEV